MTLNLFCAAMNPNLTPEDFLRLSEQAFDHQRRLIEVMFEQANKMPIERRSDYLAACLPLILM